METNLNADVHAQLREKGRALLDAAYEFWKIHRSLAGPRAVVWLEDTSGHMIVFTRGEYRAQLLHNMRPLTDEIPLDEPFTVDGKPPQKDTTDV